MSALAFERARLAWRAANFEGLKITLFGTSGCTFIYRDGARYGAGLLLDAARRSQ